MEDAVTTFQRTLYRRRCRPDSDSAFNRALNTRQVWVQGLSSGIGGRTYCDATSVVSGPPWWLDPQLYPRCLAVLVMVTMVASGIWNIAEVQNK
jgi:hypothetical protein